MALSLTAFFLVETGLLPVVVEALSGWLIAFSDRTMLWVLGTVGESKSDVTSVVMRTTSSATAIVPSERAHEIVASNKPSSKTRASRFIFPPLSFSP
jgi:hypothetical protein